MARKHCRKCGQTKTADAFQVCARNADGLQSWCRECRAVAAIEYRARMAEHRAAYNRRYHAEHREQRAAYHQANRERANAGMRARYAALSAVEKREMHRAYYEANKERHAELGRRWRETHPDEARAYNRAYYEQNKERLAEQSRVYRAEHRERYNEYSRAYRASRRQQFVENVVELVLLERDDGACGICGRDVDPLSFHVDHIIPISRGGEHSYANTQIAHPACNLRKHAKLPHELEMAA